MLIVDTGVLVAAADRTDPRHSDCAALVGNSAGQIRTTAMVIAEAAYLIERELGPDVEIATVDHRHFTVVRPRHVEAFVLLP